MGRKSKIQIAEEELRRLKMAKEKEQNEKDSSPNLASDGINPKPVEGTTVAELKNEYNEASALKKERKKPRKSLKEPLDPEKRERMERGLALFAAMSLKIICSRLPNPLPPTYEEIAQWNDAITAMIEKYFSTLSQYDAEASLVLAAIIVLLPRMKGNKDAKTGGNDFGKNGDRKDGQSQSSDNEVSEDSHT